VIRVLLIAALLAAPAAGAAPPEPPALRIYLPRTVAVEKAEALSLGDIAVVRGEDEALAAKARAIAMGRAPWSSESIVFDRHTVLARLASCGVPAERVEFTGAERVAVRPNEREVPEEQVLAAAWAHLEAQPPAAGAARWVPARAPEPLRIRADGEVSLRASTGKAPGGEALVEIAAVRDGQVLAATAVAFKAQYPQRRAVTTRDVPAGGAITPENTRVEDVYVDARAREPWSDPFGQVTPVALKAGTVLRPGLLTRALAAVLIRRNQSVVMRLRGEGFVITAVALALEDGRAGELIKVRNVDSHRVVTVRVALDGTTEPVLGKELP